MKKPIYKNQYTQLINDFANCVISESKEKFDLGNYSDEVRYVRAMALIKAADHTITYQVKGINRSIYKGA